MTKTTPQSHNTKLHNEDGSQNHNTKSPTKTIPNKPKNITNPTYATKPHTHYQQNNHPTQLQTQLAIKKLNHTTPQSKPPMITIKHMHDTSQQTNSYTHLQSPINNPHHKHKH